MSLVGRWKLNGNVTDSESSLSTSNHNLTFNHYPAVEGGESAFCTKADEASFIVADSASLDVGTTFTIMLWYKTGYTDSNVYIGGRNGDGGGTSDPRWYIVLVSDGRIQFNIRDAQADVISVLDSTAVAPTNDDRWHHAAMVRNGTTGYIYRDGRRTATDTNASCGTADNNYPMLIGDIYYNGGIWQSKGISGYIDDVRFYDGALSADDIYKIYESYFGKHLISQVTMA